MNPLKTGIERRGLSSNDNEKKRYCAYASDIPFIQILVFQALSYRAGDFSWLWNWSCSFNRPPGWGLSFFLNSEMWTFFLERNKEMIIRTKEKVDKSKRTQILWALSNLEEVFSFLVDVIEVLVTDFFSCLSLVLGTRSHLSFHSKSNLGRKGKVQILSLSICYPQSNNARKKPTIPDLF